ncbi:MAG: hypothetical protein ACOCX5_02750 [Chloroflexota bacterium]
MKAAFHLLTVLIVLAFSVTLIAAQDENQDSQDNVEVEGTFVINAASGGFEEVEDPTFVLTLEQVDESTAYVFTRPALMGGRYLISEFTDNWRFAIELDSDVTISAAALLTTEDASIIMTLSEPVFSDETLTFLATIESIMEFDATDGKSEVPATFETANLFITMEPTFMDVMRAGQQERLSSIRRITDCQNDPFCIP